MRHWPRRRRKWEQVNTGGRYPALQSGNSVNSTRGGPWGRGAFRPPSPNVGGAGRRRRWDCQRGRGERCGCGGGAYSVPAAGWEAGPARRLTRGRSGKASAWCRVRGRACAVRGGEGARRRLEGWPPPWVEGGEGWRPGLAWKRRFLVWLEI